MPHIYVPKLPANNDTSKKMFFASFGVLFLALLINAVLVRVMWMFRQGEWWPQKKMPRKSRLNNKDIDVKIATSTLPQNKYTHRNCTFKITTIECKWLVHSTTSSQYFPPIFELRTFWVGQKLILHFTHLNSLGSLLKFRL